MNGSQTSKQGASAESPPSPASTESDKAPFSRPWKNTPRIGGPIEPNIARQPRKVPNAILWVLRKAFLGQVPWPMTFIGPAGCGKTCAALAFSDHVGGARRYWTVRRLARDLRLAMQGKLQNAKGFNISEHELWDLWRTPHLAILDELGEGEAATDHHRGAVKEALDLRAGRPAIYISNRKLEDLERIYGDPIASRLNGGTLVYFPEQDMRANQGECYGS